MKELLFIISLPRSGSSYLQKLITSSEEVSSYGEPYLPLALYSLLDLNLYGAYGMKTIKSSITNLISDDGVDRDVVLENLGLACQSIYNELADNQSRYFLDKSPRNAFIGPDLLTMFPTAKFIVLTRNPLEVISSTYHTWGTGMRACELARIDMTEGINQIAALLATRSPQIHHIDYAKLVTDSSGTLKGIESFIECQIPYVAKHKNIRGYLGDPVARKTKTPAWEVTFQSPIVRQYSKSIISNLTPENLKLLGYEKSTLLRKINEIRGFQNFFVDSINYTVAHFMKRLNGYVFLRNRRTNNKYTIY